MIMERAGTDEQMGRDPLAALDPRLEVWQWLELASARQGLDPELVWQADPLARLGLTDLREQEICDLSPGQQRLVDFAALLLGSPSVYLLDAPFAGLGAPDRGRVVRVLQAAVRQGAAAVLTATDAAEIRSVAHRILRLDDGRLVEEPR